MGLTSAFLGILGLVPTMELPLETYTAMETACGGLTRAVSIAAAAYVLPRFGNGGAQPSGRQHSGGQEEAVAHQVAHVAEQSAAEGPGVEAVVTAEQGLEGADNLPNGQVAVAR
jgi:hypothetical protein